MLWRVEATAEDGVAISLRREEGNKGETPCFARPHLSAHIFLPEVFPPFFCQQFFCLNSGIHQLTPERLGVFLNRSEFLAFRSRISAPLHLSAITFLAPI